MAGQVTPLHEPWRYKWMHGTTPDHLGVTSSFIAIVVPFPHILRRVYFGAQLVTLTGVVTLTLKRAKTGDTLATIGTALVPAADANAKIQEYALGTDIDSEISAALGAIYSLEIAASNALDVVDRPALCLGISPIPPGPA